MVYVAPNTLLILGGHRLTGASHDGFLYNIESREIVHTISTGGLKFRCGYNNHCLTDDGRVVAIIQEGSKDLVLEYHIAEKQINFVEPVVQQ